jgi:hypothetical protein
MPKTKRHSGGFLSNALVPLALLAAREAWIRRKRMSLGKSFRKFRKTFRKRR